MLEHIPNKQEDQVTQDSKPFDQNDQTRIAELNAKFEGKRDTASSFEIVNRSFEGFEGAVIVQKGETFYALKKTPSGELRASEFRLTPEGGVGAIYQVRDMEQFSDVLSKIESKETEKRIEQAESLLMALFKEADGAQNGFDPFNGIYNGRSSEMLKNVKDILNALTPSDQENLASAFFEKTILADIVNNRKAYPVYGALKGTSFAEKFKQLENDRLQAAGFGSFDL